MITFHRGPLAIDLFCGLGGWTEPLLDLGWNVVGFDIKAHIYGEHRYPAQLVVQDVLRLHGSQFRDAHLIVASPPCQEYSWMAMPWSRAKQVGRALRGQDAFPEGWKGSRSIAELNRMFYACFRIQREACEAAGRHIPMVVENVKGAQPWLGRSRWNFGSYHLWGDIPALMPPIVARKSKGLNWSTQRGVDFTRLAGEQAIKNAGGSWFAVSHNNVPHSCGDAAVAEGRKSHGGGGGRDATWFQEPQNSRRRAATAEMRRDPMAATSGSSRAFASALIAKIPPALAWHIGKVYFPRNELAA